MIRRILAALMLILCSGVHLSAQEGYWILDSVTTLGEDEMDFDKKHDRIFNSGTSLSMVRPPSKIRYGHETDINLDISISGLDKLEGTTVGLLLYGYAKLEIFVQGTVDNVAKWTSAKLYSDASIHPQGIDLAGITPDGNYHMAIRFGINFPPGTANKDNVTGSGFHPFKPSRQAEIIYFYKYVDGNNLVEVTTVAGEDEGDDKGTGIPPWLIPPAILITGGEIIRRIRKNKGKDRKPEKKEEDSEDKEEEKGPSSFNMILFKEFGNTLNVGETYRVGVHIEEITAKGRHIDRPDLARQVKAQDGDNIRVVRSFMEGNRMMAEIEALNSDEPGIYQGNMLFSFISASGAFRNKVVFSIMGNLKVIFGQDNLTIPACFDDEIDLPFIVVGANDSTEISLNLNEVYNVRLEPDGEPGIFHALIRERSKKKMEPGAYEPFFLNVKAVRGGQETVESLPVYRFHMGLALDLNPTLPCYLAVKETSRGKKELDGSDYEVPKAYGHLAYFTWDSDTNRIETVNAVPTGFRIEAAESKENEFLTQLGICCVPTSTITDKGRTLELFCGRGVLDAPTRFKATITITADCGGGITETVQKEIAIASQPVRQFRSTEEAMSAYEADRRIGEGLINIQQWIFDHNEYSRLFPLYKLIDVMLDGYDGAYGYDKGQVDTVKSVFNRFINGDLLGANATPQTVTLADEMKLFCESFLQTSEDVENSMGFFTRLAVGVVTLGMSDVVFTGLKVVRDMKAEAERGGDTWDVFCVGAKCVTIEYLQDKAMEFGMGKLQDTIKKSPKVTGKIDAAKDALNRKIQDGKNFFADITGKKTTKIIEGSKNARSRARIEADDAIGKFRKDPQMSDLDKKIDEAFKNGKKHGKAKVEELQAAEWLMESNPTPENIKLYKKKVLDVQRDKFAMQQLNELPDGARTRAGFNKELDEVYKDVDADVRQILSEKGYNVDKKPFNATSSNKSDLSSGKKVTYDRDVTYKTVDGVEIPQKTAQEAYEKAFYKRTTGCDAPNAKVAREWAQMHDQCVVQKGSKVSYGDDLNPVIKDWDQKLHDAKGTGEVMTYKSTEWFEQTEQMIRKANTLDDKGLRLDMLEQALSKRQEATRQMVKQFKYVHERDLAAQTKGAISKISEKMRFGMEISSRLFSTGEDALTLGQVEAILKQNDLTLELLSLKLGQALEKIG